MCGIAGFFNGKADYLSNMKKTNEIIHNMNKELVHRGPDKRNIYIQKFCFRS